MAAPDPNLSGVPAGAVQAVLMCWDDTNSEFRPVTMTSGGKLETTAAVSTTDGPTTGTLSSVGDETSSTTVLAANADRKGATFYNDSGAILYLGLSATAVSTSAYTLQIAAQGYFELPLNDGGVYTGICLGIWASDAGGSVRVTELT